MTTTNLPDATSSDYDAMLAHWDKVEAVMGGADAVKAGGKTYLPKFPQESDADYAYRLENAKFTNVYADIASSLAAKPFAEETHLCSDASDKMKALAEDIDGAGNNLNVFASQTFMDGLNNAIDWILVDFTKASPRTDGQPLSLADEQAQGLRPYWLHIPAKRMLAVYSESIGGREIIVHARMREDFKRRNGFRETQVERIRVMNREPIFEPIFNRVVGYSPATFEVWEKKSSTGGGASAWNKIDEGPITIGVIPLVPFKTGRRIEASWQFRPPLRDALDLQIELYHQETALKSIKELAAFPMLAGNGVPAQMNADGTPAPVPVGPKTVLYAPPYGENGSHGEWKFIEPTAESLRFLADDVKNTEAQLRELGRQPLTAQAGITVVAAAFASQKASSAVQAWAMALKDALEQAFVLTALWLNDPNPPSVEVFSDFALDIGDDKGPATLLDMRKSGDLSQETLWAECRRRNILSEEFEAEEERQRLLEELPSMDNPADLTGAALPPTDPALDPPSDPPIDPNKDPAQDPALQNA